MVPASWPSIMAGDEMDQLAILHQRQRGAAGRNLTYQLTGRFGGLEILAGKNRGNAVRPHAVLEGQLDRGRALPAAHPQTELTRSKAVPCLG